MEWILAKVLRKKIIYDFDDAIWLTDKTEESWFETTLRWRTKVGAICQWSYKVSCGNSYLCDYARQFNKNVVLNPTTIDTDKMHNSLYHEGDSPLDQRGKSSSGHVVIGWTGSHSTLKYLESLGVVMESIEKKYNSVSFLIIADKQPRLPAKRIEFRKWSKETEVADLAEMDIGIMPLPDDEWTKGKCGFKALQYMAMGIPAVVSPVAVNKVIVHNKVNGLWCISEQDWIEKLSLLIEDVAIRKQLGREAQIFVNGYYSVNSNKKNFLQLFS